MSKKKAKSDLYQVDFVSALFGGFLLIWLMNPEQPVASIEEVHLMQIRATLYSRDGRTTNILPDNDVLPICIPAEALESSDYSLRPCKIDKFTTVAFGAEQGSCSGYGRSIYRSTAIDCKVVDSFGLISSVMRLETVGKDDKVAVIRPVGVAVSSRKSDVRFVAVGVASESTPVKVRVAVANSIWRHMIFLPCQDSGKTGCKNDEYSAFVFSAARRGGWHLRVPYAGASRSSDRVIPVPGRSRSGTRANQRAGESKLVVELHSSRWDTPCVTATITEGASESELVPGSCGPANDS